MVRVEKSLKRYNKPSRKLTKYKLSNYGWAYFMIAPTIIGLGILNIWPFIYTIFLSFNESGDFGAFTWTGIDNYVRLINDELVWQSVGNTFKFTFISVPIGILISLVLAVLLNSNIKGKTFYRTIYFLPMVVAPAAISMIWKWLFNADSGLINYMLSFLSIQGPNWLTNPRYSIISMATVDIWSGLGYNMIILLAGLQSIPNTYYEAAKIDGGSPFKQFLYITVPMVSPTLFFVLVIKIMGAIKQFDLVYMMIGGTNPAIEETQTILYLFYKYAFVTNEKGFASSIVLLAFIIIMLFTLLQFWLQKKWVHYD